MDAVNAWLGLALGMFGVLAGVAAMLRWTAAQVIRSLDERIDTKLDTKLDALESKIDAKLAPINRRLDALEVKVDHLAEVVDLRLRPLEEDMRLVKQHLLGTTAA